MDLLPSTAQHMDRPSLPLSTRRASLAALAGLGLILILHALLLRRWLAGNVLPDGLQNEIFHLNNALLLVDAARERSWPIVADILFAQYWPSLHYVFAFPLLWLERSRDAAVYSNLFFLGLLLTSLYGLGRQLGDRWTGVLAAGLVSLFPAIYGNLRHFEPNVPLAALVSAAILVASRSQRFAHRGSSLLFGLLAGGALMTDRLSALFFLAGPVLIALLEGRLGARRLARPRQRQALLNLALGLGLCLAVCGYYYLNFYQLHRSEVLEQVAEGEIQSDGVHSEARGPLNALAFYPLTFLDAQAGFLPGLLLLAGVGLAVWRRERSDRLLWAWILPPLVLFTLVTKKQLYYTIPLLPAVGLLAALGLSRGGKPGKIMAVLTITLGVIQLSASSFAWPFHVESPSDTTLTGLLAGQSPLPEAWVAPRYVQSHPPPHWNLRVGETLVALQKLKPPQPKFRVLTYSLDQTYFEGYLTWFIRCAFPKALVNGLTENPQGFYENMRLMDAMVFVSAGESPFPTPDAIRQTLQTSTAVGASELPIQGVLDQLQAKLEVKARFQTSLDARVTIWGLKPWQAVSPTAGTSASSPVLSP